MREFEIQTAAIIPTLNEETTVGNVVRSALRAEMVDLVVMVDDGSSDYSQRRAREASDLEEDNETPFYVVVHDKNQGKAEALTSGIDFAREIGSTALSAVVFLDADSSPVWSRDTKDNMKLWQSIVNKIAHAPPESLTPEIIKGREDVFINLLARYIDEITAPVVAGESTMRIGMYQRNIVTDTILRLANFGGHAGNRALTVEHWDKLFAELEEMGVSVSGWEIEAALNSSVPQDEVASFLMHGVVNVGSRKKTGSMAKGMRRMITIHGQALRGMKKFRQ